jgi:exosortase K
VRFGREAWSWQSLLWWLAVLAVVVQLKHYYSTASAAELAWVLRPLAQLLEWFTGHEFHRDNRAEWVSETADVRLVTGCAGINFMLMSFMAYAWVARPQRCAGTGLLPWIVRRLPLLFAAIAAAWATGLVANSLRIMVAMSLEARGWRLDAVGIGAPELHRLIGMAVYLPVLSVQMMWADRGMSRGAVAASFLLYLLLMVVVPLFTGNAVQHPTLFLEHLLSVSVMMGVTWGICFLLPAVYRRRGARRSDSQTGSGSDAFSQHRC